MYHRSLCSSEKQFQATQSQSNHWPRWWDQNSKEALRCDHFTIKVSMCASSTTMSAEASVSSQPCRIQDKSHSTSALDCYEGRCCPSHHHDKHCIVPLFTRGTPAVSLSSAAAAAPDHLRLVAHPLLWYPLEFGNNATCTPASRDWRHIGLCCWLLVNPKGGRGWSTLKNHGCPSRHCAYMCPYRGWACFASRWRVGGRLLLNSVSPITC